MSDAQHLQGESHPMCIPHESAPGDPESGDLLHAGSSAHDAAARVRQHDLLRPEQFSDDTLRTLEMIHKSFAETLQSSLAAYLRTHITIEVLDAEVMTYEAFTRLLPTPTLFMNLALQPTEGSAALEIHPNVGIALLDRLLGGPGSVPPTPRALTAIEQTLFRRIISKVTSSLECAWRQVLDQHTVIQRSAIHPQFTLQVPKADPNLVTRFKITMGKASGTMHLCLPNRMLKSIESTRQTGALSNFDAHDHEERREIWQRLKAIRLPVVVEIGKSTATFADLLDLEAGDVIPLNRRRGDLLGVKVGPRLKFYGKPRRIGDQFAVELVSRIEQEDE